jgi:Arc/MetJ family transcription regulator
MKTTQRGRAARIQVRLTEDLTTAVRSIRTASRRSAVDQANNLLEAALQYVLTPGDKEPITLTLDALRSGHTYASAASKLAQTVTPAKIDSPSRRRARKAK